MCNFDKLTKLVFQDESLYGLIENKTIQTGISKNRYPKQDLYQDNLENVYYSFEKICNYYFEWNESAHMVLFVFYISSYIHIAFMNMI